MAAKKDSTAQELSNHNEFDRSKVNNHNIGLIHFKFLQLRMTRYQDIKHNIRKLEVDYGCLSKD